MTYPDFSFERKLSRRGFKFIAGVDEVGKGCFAGPIVTGCVIFSDSFWRVTRVAEPQERVKQQESLHSRHPLSKRVTRAGETQSRGPLVGGFGAGERQALFIPAGVIINDSKKMRPKQREKSAVWIKENALAWGIGEVGAGIINSKGMAKAARQAFRLSISEARKRLGRPIDYLLSDAFFISFVPGLPAKRRKNKKGRFYKKVSGRQQAIINGDEKSVSIAAASIIAKVYRDDWMRKLGKRPKYRKYGWGRNKGYGTREHQKAILKYGITRQHRKAFVATFLSKKIPPAKILD
jgi:ribonuclease HII